MPFDFAAIVVILRRIRWGKGELIGSGLVYMITIKYLEMCRNHRDTFTFWMWEVTRLVNEELSMEGTEEDIKFLARIFWKVARIFGTT